MGKHSMTFDEYEDYREAKHKDFAERCLAHVLTVFIHLMGDDDDEEYSKAHPKSFGIIPKVGRGIGKVLKVLIPLGNMFADSLFKLSDRLSKGTFMGKLTNLNNCDNYDSSNIDFRRLESTTNPEFNEKMRQLESYGVHDPIEAQHLEDMSHSCNEENMFRDYDHYIKH